MQNESCLSLLLDAPTEHVEACQRAMAHVAAGEWREAARTLQFAADWQPEGDTWADRAEKFAAVLRAKA
jgi:hypothetical protein